LSEQVNRLPWNFFDARAAERVAPGFVVANGPQDIPAMIAIAKSAGWFFPPEKL